MNLIVSGSRHLNDIKLVRHTLIKASINWDWTKLTLLVGDNKGTATTKGADQLAILWADRFWITRRIYKAEWSEHGRSAGPRRNAEMVADALTYNNDDGAAGARCVAFWDGRVDGCGTHDMIQQAKAAGIKTRIVKVCG